MISAKIIANAQDDVFHHTHTPLSYPIFRILKQLRVLKSLSIVAIIRDGIRERYYSRAALPGRSEKTISEHRYLTMGLLPVQKVSLYLSPVSRWLLCPDRAPMPTMYSLGNVFSDLGTGERLNGMSALYQQGYQRH